MRTKVLLGAAVVLMLVVSVATIGSNMGFKISIPLKALSGSPRNDGMNWIALPYYVNYADSAALAADIPNFLQVAMYDPATSTFTNYDGVDFPTPFPIAPGGELAKGMAILVKVSTDTNWVVVGSHAPTLQLPLKALSASPRNDGMNWVSIPYHSTKTDSAGLMADIGPNCLQVAIYDPSTSSYINYDGVDFPTPFTLTPGQAVLVKVASDTNYAPSHY